MQNSNLKAGLPVYAGVLATSRNSLRKRIGVVEKVEGSEYLKLKKENGLDQRPFWIPVSWVEQTDTNGIYLSKLEDEIRGGMFDSLPPMDKVA